MDARVGHAHRGRRAPRGPRALGPRRRVADGQRARAGPAPGADAPRLWPPRRGAEPPRGAPPRRAPLPRHDPPGHGPGVRQRGPGQAAVVGEARGAHLRDHLGPRARRGARHPRPPRVPPRLQRARDWLLPRAPRRAAQGALRPRHGGRHGRGAHGPADAPAARAPHGHHRVPRHRLFEHPLRRPLLRKRLRAALPAAGRRLAGRARDGGRRGHLGGARVRRLVLGAPRGGEVPQRGDGRRGRGQGQQGADGGLLHHD
mmetsp:Transcript_2996/g.9844  ORF Transcript_2996/g.9844 Transcript_2996/m.9844 type:complete len:258 (+) Transcript_2996:2518-3291(+)